MIGNALVHDFQFFFYFMAIIDWFWDVYGTWVTHTVCSWLFILEFDIKGSLMKINKYFIQELLM